jgi:hypothetical protein
MSVKIVTLGGEFEKAALQEYCNGLFLQNKQLLEKNVYLVAEVEHLKRLLTASAPLLNSNPSKVGETIAERMYVSPEKEATQIQIRILRDRAMTEELTFEEVKKLEILVKTLKTIDTKINQEDPNKVVPTPVGTDNLVALALRGTEDV